MQSLVECYSVTARYRGEDPRPARMIERVIRPEHDMMGWNENCTEWTWDMEDSHAALDLMHQLMRVVDLEVTLRILPAVTNGRFVVAA